MPNKKINIQDEPTSGHITCFAMMTFSLLLMVLVFFGIWISPAHADEMDQVARRGSTLSLVYENDVFNNRDGHYTNGIRLSWIHGSRTTPNWAVKVARLIPWFPRGSEVLHGYSVGQSMFTPIDISEKDPPEGTRPYAGWLYASIGLGVETGKQLDQVVITLGMVGPASLADKTQKEIHRLINTSEPRGWDTQLHNEPGLMISWQRSWRALVLRRLLERQLDITPHLGLTVGNVHSYVNSGLTLRFGGNLPLDYGPPRIQPGAAGTSSFVSSPGVGWYLFAGVEGRAVARNIFLDGNSFRSSRSVDKKLLVGDLQFGGVVVWRDVRLSYTHVFRTREFKTQDKRDNFGAVTVSVQF